MRLSAAACDDNAGLVRTGRSVARCGDIEGSQASRSGEIDELALIRLLSLPVAGSALTLRASASSLHRRPMKATFRVQGILVQSEYVRGLRMLDALQLAITLDRIS